MKILDIENDLLINDGALLRGEQVFTSLLFYEGKFLFLQKHLERLFQGAHYLFPEVNWPQYKIDIEKYVLLKIKNLNNQNYYCRLTIVGNYFFMKTKQHLPAPSEINLINAYQMRTPSLRPSYLKFSQYADSFLEKKKAQLHGANDIIYFDDKHFLTEASTSNIFVVESDHSISTPYLSSMVLSGIMRSKLCDYFSIKEKNITEKDLVNAREIWLSNSIQGLRFVKKLNDK